MRFNFVLSELARLRMVQIMREQNISNGEFIRRAFLLYDWYVSHPELKERTDIQFPDLEKVIKENE